MTYKRKILLQYLQALETNDLNALLSLFSAHAKVVSPLYGTKPALDFYQELFKDTIQSKLELHHIFENEGDAAALHFHYEWTLANGQKTHFEVVDIVKFDETEKIKHLTIIYDTALTRSTFDRVASS